MDEDEKPETEDELTPDGQEVEDETGGEANRIGDLDDLRDRLERIENALGAITETLEAMCATAAAIDIDNGADVMGDDGDADIVADDEIDIPDYEDMDLDL